MQFSVLQVSNFAMSIILVSFLFSNRELEVLYELHGKCVYMYASMYTNVSQSNF